MIDFLTPAGPFGGQTQRLAAEALQGGGDLFDIARTAATIEDGDLKGWEKAWLNLAQRTEARAKEALASGHTRTAMENFFAANQYYRQSDVFIQDTNLKAERFTQARNCFRAGAEHHTSPVEVITVKCGSDEYDGYFCAPRDPAPGRWPAVCFIGGADAFAEEIFFSGRKMLERGWAVLIVDTPGRGSSSYLKNIPTRPDYEVPVSSCIDYLVDRPEVDSDRIALMGISMGGYYAPRAAVFENRIKALVSWCGCYSLLDDLYLFYEPLRPTLQRILGGVTDADARRRLKEFSMEGIASKISVPTLITHGTEDRLMDVNGARRLFDEVGASDKELKLYDGSEGGAGHCNYDNWAQSIPYMLDWLEKRL